MENAIERGVILSRPNETMLKPEHLPFELSFSDLQQKPTDLPLTGELESLLANYEREILKKCIEQTQLESDCGRQGIEYF